MKGKDVSIPKGHEVTVYTNTDYLVVPAKFAETNTSSPAATQAPVSAIPLPHASPTQNRTGATLTNVDVIKLKESGLGDELIISKITHSPGNYKLDTDDLIALKKAGLLTELPRS